MQKIFCFSLLWMVLSLNVQAQEASLAKTHPWLDVIPSNPLDRVGPPKMLPPEMLETPEGMLFRWEQPALPSNANLEYEFILLDEEGQLVFKTRTSERKIQYSKPFPSLVFYRSYRVVVNTRVTDDNVSYVISGEEAAVSFTYYPVCTAPRNLNAQQRTDHTLEISWEGLDAAPGVVAYQVRSKPAGQIGAEWTTLLVTNGRSATIKLKDLGIPYEIEVQKICFWKDGSQVLSDPLRIEANTVPVTAEGGNCGGNYSFPLCQGPYSNKGNWTTLSIGGFLINVLTITPEVLLNQQTGQRDTVWDGTGRLSLPFGSTFVKVQWDNVRINQLGMICGTVTGMADAPQYWPNLNPGPAIWGDEICKPAPSAPGFDSLGIHSETGMPWDPNGFGPGGEYDKQPPYPGYEPGMPFDSLHDPNGFNAQGIHFQTGSIYGPNGCSQNGLDSLGQPCSPDTIPYYWLQDTLTANTEAYELLEEVQDSLEFWIRQRLMLWANTFQDTISQVTSECQSIRGVMNGLIIALGYSDKRELLLGVDEEYFSPGMWKNFSAPPQRLNYNIQRNANQDSLESKHVSLYYCDKKLDTYTTFKGIVDSLLLANSGVPDLAGVIEDMILELSESEAENFKNDRAAFLVWLYDKLRPYLSNTFCDGQCSRPLQKPEQRYKQPVRSPADAWGALQSKRVPPVVPRSIEGRSPAGNMLAFGGGPIDGQLLSDAETVTPQDLEFEYLQGWKYVNGIHRAYYLEAIGEMRRLAALSPSATVHDAELMPIEVGNRASDGRKYSIWLDQMVFTPDSAVFDAYIVLELPNGGKKIALSALDLKFTPLGLVNNPAKLQLDNDVVVRMNNAVQLTLKEGPNTFVAFDCDGYAGLGLDIDIEVCRNIVKPINPTTFEVLPDPERVSTNIQVFLPTFDELYAEINIEPFVINGLEDFKWMVNGIVIDFSDVKSPAFEPPPGYASPFVSGTSFSPLWRGFYMRTLSVRMPNHFNNNGSPMQIGVEKVVLDHMGVSGTVYAKPLLDLNNGNAGGWAFSVDEFRLTVLANQPAAANFYGKIHVPIFSKGTSGGGGGGGSNGGGSFQNGDDEKGNSAESMSGTCNTGAPTADDCFAYTAFIEPGTGSPKYRMTVNTNGNNWCVDMWKAGQVTINSGSQIDMVIENGQFSVKAKLNGTVKITEALSPSLAMSIPNITFQNLIIQNKSPYFTPGTWGFPTPNSVGASFGGFGINLSDIKMVQSGDDPGLSFNAGIKIASGGVNLTAEGGFIIRGQMTTINGRQRWTYKNFGVDEIKLDGSFSGVARVHGILQFYDEDATFGTGWRGGVGLTIKGFAEITAVAQFGRITHPINYKYFFIDAMACLDQGWGTALVLKGFGGGVYYHMNRPPSAFASFNNCTGSTTIPSGLGVSLSGIQYTPDVTKGVGIKATIVLASAVKQNAFNGNATLELLFNAGGGLSDLWIYGNARFMSVPDKNASPEKTTQNGASVSADLDMHMNFNTSTFDGNFQVFLNVAGGVVRGGGPGNRLGQAIIHIDPSTWYVKIGTPSARCSLVIDIPVIGEIGNISSYLEFGKDLDPMPPLPSDIAQLTGLTDYAGLSNRGSALGGNGFIFGADLNVGKQDMEFLIFYAGLRAHLGFDVAILDYGPNAVCANTGQQVGINGWYASGQVYAGIWGEMGIKVKVFGKRKQFKIFEVAIAAALQASLPNPFWAKGAVGGHYSILGGLVKGECHFDVTIGQRCQVVGADDPLAELTVVQRVVPEEGTTGFAVDGKPEVYFNFPIGQAFTLTDPNNNSVTYKATVDQIKLRYYGGDVSRSLEWAADKRSVKIAPDWFLPGNDTIKVVIISHVDSSNIRIYDEERVSTFITGPGLRHIPPANVKGSYPFDGQFNFYKNEIPNKKGYIMLHRGQVDLDAENGETLLVRFQSSGGAKTETPIAFIPYSTTKLEFDIPTGYFSPGGIYRMQIVRKQQGSNSGEEIAYTAFFRASQYGTFAEKINAWISGKQNLPYQNYVLKAKTNMEPFDLNEIGSSALEGMIKLRGCYTANNYYDNTVKPILYDNYPLKHNTVQVTETYRTNDSREGFPPTKAVFFQQASSPPAVKESDWLSGSVSGGGNTDVTLSHEVFKYCSWDYEAFMEQTMMFVMPLSNNIHNQGNSMSNCTGTNGLCNSGCSLISGDLKEFYCFCMQNQSFPEPPVGQYKVMIKYALPGLGVPSTYIETSVQR